MSEPVRIEEKVRFWEEQDRINQELIPRVIRQNELLSQHIAEHENLQQILSDTRSYLINSLAVLSLVVFPFGGISYGSYR